jgi:hypothetical protein
MRGAIADRNALPTFAAIALVHPLVAGTELYRMEGLEYLSGKGDIPHHRGALTILDQVAILGIELEDPPSRVDLSAP